QHRRAQLDSRHRGVGRVVGKVEAGADGDLQDAAVCTLAEPLPSTAELDLLEERDLLVVARGALVPHPPLSGGRGLAGLRLGGAGHRAGPSMATGLGREQSASEATAALTTPITASRTRAGACPASGRPASSQAMIASIATTGASCAAHLASASFGT